MAAELADLRSLSDWFARSALSENRTQLATLVRRLGAIAVPLLGREVRQPDTARRDAAREALALLAGTAARERVLTELRAITTADPGAADVIDEAKVCALGLLAELGEPGEARFRDPRAMQRRSALALAAQLDTAADVASAVDFMVRQLPDEDILQIVELVAGAVPVAAAHLAAELAARLDVSSELRACVADTAAELACAAAATLPAPAPASRRPGNQPVAAVLLDSAARMVVVTTRRVPGERRWRRWAILIGPSGAIDDCLHEDTTDDRDGAALVAELCADGYRIASQDPTHARAAVTAAARLAGPDLPPAYYLGRDLLDLGDAHLGTRHARRAAHDRIAATLGRASELLADGEPVRARALLERTPLDPTTADRAALEAACLVAEDKLAEALAPLRAAAAAEPSWPLHHWNLGVVLYRLGRLGDAAAAHQSLQRFVATSAAPTALAGDPAQPARLADAERLVSELERTARLAGSALRSTAPRTRPRSRRRNRGVPNARARSDRPPR